MSEWKTMESAPKDGTWIMVTGTKYDNNDVPAYGFTRWVVEIVETWERAGPKTQKLVERDDSHWDYAAPCELIPTHWQELPAPPPKGSEP